MLIRSDLPLWTKCTCRRLPQVSAQLMRLHVVTPKAPVTVILNPRVQVHFSSSFSPINKRTFDSNPVIVYKNVFVVFFKYT